MHYHLLLNKAIKFSLNIRIIVHLFFFSLVTLIEPTFSNNKFKKNKNLKYLEINSINDKYKSDTLKKSLSNTFLYEDKFDIPAKLNNFFYVLLANLEEESSMVNKTIPSVELFSDKQSSSGSLMIAEGNVILKSNNAILNSSKLSYDQDSKVLNISGNIKFKSEDSFLEASDIEYDFINKKGFILNAYGSVNFKKVSKIQLSKENNSNQISDDIFKFEKSPKEVKFNSDSFIKFGNVIKQYDEDNSFIDQEFEAKLNPIIKTRFFAKRIDIDNTVWSSDDLTLTNDPFNEPQLKIRNKNFKASFDEDSTRIRSKWSWARFEDKISIPIGPRRIDVDKNQNFKWGNGYDKEKYDGFFIFRRFNKIKFDEITELNLTKFFPIQRIIYGETESFPNKNDLVLSPRVKQDANFADYLGFGALLKSEKNNWKYIFDINTNSLDFEKLDKSTQINSYLTINLSDEEINKKVNESIIHDLNALNYNFKKSDDLTFFGSYRSKTKNGSLGEIIVKSSYGVRYDITSEEEKNNIKSFTKKSFTIGNYESSSSLDSNNLINKNRLNLSFKRGYDFALWKPKVESFITDEYKFSPIIIPQGLFWNIEGNLDFFRYEGDGDYRQDLFLVKTGPKFTIGEFKKNLFDYTEISIMPRFKFNRGKSPFNFDQVVDNKAIELKASQQIYGPFILNFTAEISLDKEESNNDELINPVLDLSWNRRAYSLNLFYNLDSEVGGINFKINTFDFRGAGERFN